MTKEEVMRRMPRVEARIGEKAAPEEKMASLKEYIRELGSLALAFSGGVDSTFLLKTAHEVLKDRLLAVTVCSHFFPAREMEEAAAFCRQEGIAHVVIAMDELSIPGFTDNPPDRCYLCKRELFLAMQRAAEERGFENLAEGSNLDDNADYRPGMIAIGELGVRSPLRACSLTKKEIRYLSRQMELPTWKKPSFACLATRFEYGETITPEKLQMVEQAENLLQDLGFHQIRVRIHGYLARIEITPEEFPEIMGAGIREKIVSELKQYGFHYVALDLQGYRQGSMNETLDV